ncbi:MAG: arylamine N-acetyltransferase [Rhodoferax sp.]|nr:arylamine N-acetyltransferase [Rhodoferax sp.]
MDRLNNASHLNTVLRDKVLERLGFSKPPTVDLDGLRALYYAWCISLPFDNVRKMIALRKTGSHFLPGGYAEDFLECWLTDGTGGTCWPSSNALFELVRSLGFESQRIVGHMRDLGIVNHGSVRVGIDGRHWLVDSSLLYNTPLPLERTVFVQDDPVFPAEVEPTGDGNHLLWVEVPPNPGYMPCRLLANEVTHAFYLACYASSHERSPFNQRLYARRNRPDELLVLVGNKRISKSRVGLSSRDLSAAELRQALRDDIGLSNRMIEDWVLSGSLEASFEAPCGSPPPPLTGEPPSKRCDGHLSAPRADGE